MRAPSDRPIIWFQSKQPEDPPSALVAGCHVQGGNDTRVRGNEAAHEVQSPLLQWLFRRRFTAKCLSNETSDNESAARDFSSLPTAITPRQTRAEHPFISYNLHPITAQEPPSISIPKDDSEIRTPSTQETLHPLPTQAWGRRKESSVIEFLGGHTVRT